MDHVEVDVAADVGTGFSIVVSGAGPLHSNRGLIGLEFGVAQWPTGIVVDDPLVPGRTVDANLPTDLAGTAILPLDDAWFT